MAARQQILVVDDSLLARIMLKKFVSKVKPDAVIIEGKDGSDALAKVNGIMIDIALLDYNMPGMSGLDLAKILKEMNDRIKIALITANIQDHIANEARDLGVTFIPKPIDEGNIITYFSSLEK